jgi:hypothetical protein
VFRCSGISILLCERSAKGLWGYYVIFAMERQRFVASTAQLRPANKLLARKSVGSWNRPYRERFPEWTDTLGQFFRGPRTGYWVFRHVADCFSSEVSFLPVRMWYVRAFREGTNLMASWYPPSRESSSVQTTRTPLNGCRKFHLMGIGVCRSLPAGGGFVLVPTRRWFARTSVTESPPLIQGYLRAPRSKGSGAVWVGPGSTWFATWFMD